MQTITSILSDPNLSEATLKFCNHIVENYSFTNVLEGALKKTTWHHYIPSLVDEETNS